MVDSFTDTKMIIIYVPVVILLMLTLILGYFVYSNNQLIKELQTDAELNDNEISNIIDAVNYNDNTLFEKQKYLYSIYEENNNFSDTDNKKKHESSNTDQYYNMMKNYDALIRLTK